MAPAKFGSVRIMFAEDQSGKGTIQKFRVLSRSRANRNLKRSLVTPTGVELLCQASAGRP